MKISWSLSAMLHRTGIDINNTQLVKEILIGKEIWLDRGKTIGHITDIFPETDLVYGEIPDKEYEELLFDSKGLHMCSFEIAKEDK